MKLESPGSEDHVDSTSFDRHREQADRERRLRRADPIIEDGTYGFNQGGGHNSQPSGFYSDQMMVDAPNRRRHR